MSHRSFAGTVILVAMSISGGPSQAQDYLYRDDDLLCRPGWSSDLYYDRIQAYELQQRMSYAEYQRAMAYNAAVEQKIKGKIQIARKARAEKDARRKEELLARRKAAVTGINSQKTTSAPASSLIGETTKRTAN